MFLKKSILISYFLFSLSLSVGANASTLNEFHSSVAAKFGYELNQVTVDVVNKGDHYTTIDGYAQSKETELIEFAKNLNISSKFSYKVEGGYWKVVMPDHKSAYTYQIGIYRHGIAYANMHCLALLSPNGRSGVPVGCGVYDIQ